MIKNEITLIDILEGIQKIPDESVDAIIADPPYNIGKDFGNDSDRQDLLSYVEWSKKWLSEFKRVLKPTGTGYIYGFSEILAHISVHINMPNRWLIWHYTNKNTPHCSFWQRSHESIITFWKDTNKRVFHVDKAREPYSEQFLENSVGKKRAATKGRFSDGITETVYNAHPMGAFGRDVIKVPSLAGGSGIDERIYWCQECNDVFVGNKKDHNDHNIEEHPTQKPQELTKKLLDVCSVENMTVLIPFAGSGSECLYCQRNRVDFYATDINQIYVDRGNRLLKKYCQEKEFFENFT